MNDEADSATTAAHESATKIVEPDLNPANFPTLPPPYGTFGDLIEHKEPDAFMPPPAKFFHYRLKDPKFNRENGYKSRYLPKGGVTVCMLPVCAVNAVGYEIAVGMAVCSPADVYSKKTGRNKSRGRAEQIAKGNEGRLETDGQIDPIHGAELAAVAGAIAGRAWGEVLYNRSNHAHHESPSDPRKVPDLTLARRRQEPA